MRSKIALVGMLAVLLASSAQAELEKPQYQITEKGFCFHSRYRLQLSPSVKFTPKSILITASCGPCIYDRAQRFDPPHRPFGVELRQDFKGRKLQVGLDAGPEGVGKINLKSSSPLYLGCKKLL